MRDRRERKEINQQYTYSFVLILGAEEENIKMLFVEERDSVASRS